MDQLPQRRSYGPGDILIREGGGGDSFYWIESGSVEVYKRAPTGDKVVIGHIPAGGIFGELAAIDEHERMASVRALEPTICRIFPSIHLKEKIAHSDELVQTIINIFVQNIRKLTEAQIQKPR